MCISVFGCQSQWIWENLSTWQWYNRATGVYFTLPTTQFPVIRAVWNNLPSDLRDNDITVVSSNCWTLPISDLSRVLFNRTQAHPRKRSHLWNQSRVLLPQTAGRVTSWQKYSYVSLFTVDINTVLRFYCVKLSKKYLWCWIIVSKLCCC